MLIDQKDCIKEMTYITLARKRNRGYINKILIWYTK